MRLALIAYDNKKVDLVAWATFNRDLLRSFELVATGHTAHLIRDKVGLDIRALLRVCDVHDVPAATNLATANLVITALALREPPCELPG